MISMSKKHTDELKVITVHLLSEKEIVINPNDGFDLGLMMTEAAVELHFGNNPAQFPDNTKYPPIQTRLIQKNECRPGTVELGSKSIQKLEGNTKIRLCLEEQDGHSKLLIGSI